MKRIDHFLGRLDLLLRRKGLLERESFGLHHLDHLISEYVYHRNGIFVEAGANDGVNQSNTLYFEKYLGWTGILIEPIPKNAKSCKTNRPNAHVEQCALVPYSFENRTIDIHYCNLMSVVDGCFDKPDLERHLDSARQFLESDDPVQIMTVPAKTLSEVIDKARVPRIDLLSLDVEGFEVQVLEGLDMDRHAPAWMVIEGSDPSLILDCVGHAYEHVAALTQGDQLYRRR